MGLSRAQSIVAWILQLVVAGILFQTLFFKFTGAEESVYIFRTLGMEPWGRIGSGVVELIAVLLLLHPRTAVFGAALSVGVISGAIVSHLAKLGIEIKGDHGLLFWLAVGVFVGGLAILWIRRTQIPSVGHLFRPLHELKAGAEKKRILILGGGFGGMYAAIEFEKMLARDRDLDVTLVNRENFFLFTPMLHEVAASDLELTDIVNPARKLLHRVKLFCGEVAGVDTDAKTVRLVHGEDGHSHDVPYDKLIVTLGSETNFYNLPGVQKHALTMKTLGDAIQLRNRVIAALEEADTECAVARRGLLTTMVVVGGGFAGVETIGAVNDFVRNSLRFYPHLSGKRIRMVLIHSGSAILPELGEELGRYAQEKLAKEGVEILTNARVAGMSADGVQLKDGAFISAGLVVWTAGAMPHALCGMFPCEKVRGRLKVDERLQMVGSPDIWAFGDCAAVPDSQAGGFHPPTAQHALREGKVAAWNVLASIRGEPTQPFKFKTLGQLAAIGRRAGVAKVFGFKFSGFVAWFLWRSIYLSKLPRFEKKVRVALGWTLDLFFTKDLVQYQTALDRPRSDILPEPELDGSPKPARIVASPSPELMMAGANAVGS